MNSKRSDFYNSKQDDFRWWEWALIWIVIVGSIAVSGISLPLNGLN